MVVQWVCIQRKVYNGIKLNYFHHMTFYLEKKGRGRGEENPEFPKELGFLIFISSLMWQLYKKLLFSKYIGGYYIILIIYLSDKMVPFFCLS